MILVVAFSVLLFVVNMARYDDTAVPSRLIALAKLNLKKKIFSLTVTAMIDALKKCAVFKKYQDGSASVSSPSCPDPYS